VASVTVNFNFPRPDRDADPEQHVDEALDGIAAAHDQMDALFKTHADAIAGKAAADHVHTLAQVTGLVDALAGKMAANATFTFAGLTDVVGAAAAPDGYVPIKIGDVWIPASAAAALGDHEHPISAVVGLEEVLEGLDDGSGISDKAAFRAAIGLSYADAAAQAALLAAIGIEAGAEGDILYRGGDGLLKKLAKGTAGQKLRQNAGLTAPEWESGWETIYCGDIAAAAALDFTDLGAYRILHMIGRLTPSTNGTEVFARFSTDSGSSFDAGSNYDHTGIRTDSAGSTALNGSRSALKLNADQQVDNGRGTFFEATLMDWNQAARCMCHVIAWLLDGSSARQRGSYMVNYTGSTARDALRFVAASGNVGGFVLLSGIRG
jgi:hypothetical protein